MSSHAGCASAPPSVPVVLKLNFCLGATTAASVLAALSAVSQGIAQQVAGPEQDLSFSPPASSELAKALGSGHEARESGKRIK